MHFSNKDCQYCSEEDASTAPISSVALLIFFFVLFVIFSGFILLKRVVELEWLRTFLLLAFVASVSFAVLSLPRFLHRNVFGRTLWLMRGPDGKIHLHRRYPKSGFELGDGGLYLKFRYGGIFQISSIAHKSVILEAPNPQWSATCHPQRFVISDRKGNEIVFREIKDAFAFLEEVVGTGSLPDFWEFVIDLRKMYSAANKRSYEYLQDMQKAEAQRDRLGVAMMKLVKAIRESKETMGKSKHAQFVRNRIEELTRTFPLDLQVQWRRQAELELEVEDEPPEPLAN